MTGKTNLPPETELLVSVTGQNDIDFRGQAKCRVQDDRTFTAEPIGKSSGLPAGEYEVDVTMPIARVQPTSVQRVIGDGGEHLRGELVSKSDLGVNVEAVETVPVPTQGDSNKSRATADHQVIQDATFHDIKRSVTVRLPRRVSKETLTSLAKKLHAQDPDYERTFIEYLLPGMEAGAGAWATAHFNPELEVKILGATAEERERLVNADDREQVEGKVLGRWLNERVGITTRITIYRAGDKYVKKETFDDGSSSTDELVERDSPHGRAFAVPDARFGEHYVIRSGGELQVRDDDGLISTAEQIK